MLTFFEKWLGIVSANHSKLDWSRLLFVSPPFSVIRNITESIGCLGAVCAWHCDGAEKVWRRAGGGREGRTCGMVMSQIAGTASYSCGVRLMNGEQQGRLDRDVGN